MIRDIDYHRNRAASYVAGLTLDEKMKVLYGTFEEKMEMGIPFIDFYGEAAHGVQARHDQDFDYGEPVCTTIFPNPIGMAASFDKKMMHRIGEVVGTEMRCLLNEFKHNGVVALAPTVDMERDPRWGRNEEAYGEDPHLTSRMAGEYILGMAGDDEKYVRCGATLKHFYANNYENDRYATDSRMPEDLKEVYYLRVFKEVIDYAHPVSVMTSYNRINGVTAAFNPEVKSLLREWGVPFIVSDAFSLERAINGHHTSESAEDSIKKAFEATVDGFMEAVEFEKPAMENSLKTGMIKEEDLDRALTNKFTVYSLLGLMKEDLESDGSSKAFPKSRYNMSGVDTFESRELAREAGVKSTVLLKNDGILPLKESDKVYMFGPFVDRNPVDWYSGISSNSVTLKQGIGASCETLYPYVRIKLEDDKYAGLKEDVLTPVVREEAELFRIMLWDESRITLSAVKNGKLLSSIPLDTHEVTYFRKEGEYKLYAKAEDAFSWFANEAFQFIDANGDIISFTEENALDFWKTPEIRGIKNFDGTLQCTFETVKDVNELLTEAANREALDENTYILACFGLHPIVNCKEERDRDNIILPPFEKAVLKELRKRYRNINLVLTANAPLDVTEEDNASEIRSILWSAFGSEELGNAFSDIVFGRKSPAGRLPQTWYRDSQLPDIEDYDIRKNGMTYLYMREEPLYRFGYGLSYSNFETEMISEDGFKVRVRNVGEYISDYVLQIYQSPEGENFLYGQDRYREDVLGREIPVESRLVAFERVPDVKPGEEVIVTLR